MKSCLCLRVVIVAFTVASTLGCELVTPSNPFDPATPGDEQASGSIVGTVVMVDDVDAERRILQLNAIRVGLVDENGRRLERDGAPVENTLNDIDVEAGSGTFAFDELVPGVYAPVFSGLPSTYLGNAVSPLRLLPGATVDIGDVVFRDQSGDSGPGSISGTVAFDGGGDGSRTISLFSRSARGVRLAASVVSNDGVFNFGGLELGSYAIVADGAARVPAYRLDIEVGETAGAALAHTFVDEAQIVLHPLSSAALPLSSERVLLDDGVFYVRDPSVSLAVLSATSAADVGVTGMRVGLDETFVDTDGNALPFTPYAASAEIALPAREGRIPLFVQLEAQSPGGFIFTSPPFATSVVRDVTPPSVLEARIGGVAVADDGVFLSRSRSLVVEFDGADDTSGVDRVAVVLADAEPAVLVFDDVTVAPGLARFSRNLGASADGAIKAFVRLRDKAGNESVTTTLDLVVDESPPDVSLVVDNAVGGTLASRLARVSFTPNSDVDAPVAMQLRVQGGSFGARQPFGAGVVVVDSTLGNHGDTVAIEARLFDRVDNTLDVSRDVVLDLTGRITGVVDAEGVPLVTPSPAQAVTRVLNSDGVLVGSDVVGDDGLFVIDGIPEGSTYRLEVELDGYRTATLSAVNVDAPGALASITDVGAVFVGLARGDLRVDVDVDGAAAPGVPVTIVLESPSGAPRRFADASTTNAAGSAVFSDVPVTRAGESMRIEAVRADDGAVAVTQTAVVANVETVALVSLAARGDFDLCADSGPCTPTAFVNSVAVRVALRGASSEVDELLVSVNGGPSVATPLAVDNATSINLGAAFDGRVDVRIQPRAGGVPVGGVLRGSVVLDRVAPTSLSISRLAAANAIDPRFTNSGLIDVVVDADFSNPDTPDTAPADAPRIVVADVVPLLVPAELLGCTHGEPCAVSLPQREGVLRLHAVACDRAANCAPAVSTFVIRDVTAPRAQNGVAFRAFAEGSVVDAGVTVVRDSSYRGELSLGTGTDAAGGTVVDDGGLPVADVFAFRASLDARTLGVADVRRFSAPPVANALRAGGDVVVPALEDLDSVQTVFVDVIDAAGNSSAQPLSASVRIDDSAPGLLVSLTSQSATQAVLFTTATPVGAEDARTVDVRVDGGDIVSFTLPLPANASVVLPDVDGLHDVVFSGRDLVGNVVNVTRRITLDRVGPRIDLVRCVSAGCVSAGDNGGATLLTSDAVLTLQVNAVDAATSVASIAVTVTPLDGAVRTPVTTSFAATAAISGVALLANVRSTIDVVAIDVVGNVSATFGRTVTQDAVAPAITDLVLANGARSTKTPTVPVHVEVAAGDAVSMRLSSSTTFAGPASSFRSDDNFVLGGNDGAKTICVEVADSAANRSNRCATINLDRSSPTGSVSLVGASPRSLASAEVELVYPADTTRVAVSKNALACDPVTTPYVAATGSPQRLSVALDAGDGVRTIFACFEDEAGGTAQATTAVVLDQSPPVISVEVNGGAEFALAAAVNVDVIAPADVADLALAVDTSLDCALASYVPFVQSSTVTLPSGDGRHTVVACSRDRAGNVSAPSFDDIELDLNAPTGTVIVEGGARFTRSEQVTVVLTRSADVTAMALAADALSCATADFVAFQSTALLRLGGSDGLRLVVACLKDAAGRVNVGNISDSIELDRRAPVGTIVVAGGALTTPVAAVSVQLTFDADTVGVFVSATPVACDTVAFGPPAATAEVTLPFVGNNIVIACLKDGAGNISSVSDDIFVEAVVGDQLVIAIEGGAATTRSRSVTVNVVRPSTNFDSMKLAEASNLDCADLTGYEAFNSSKSLTLSAGNAPFEGTRTVAACVRDSTSPTRAPLSAVDTIFVDSFAPAGSVAINGGDVVTGSANVTLTLANTFAPQNEVVTVALSEASTLVGGQCSGSFETFAAGKGFTFSGLDGNRSIFVCLHDSAGNTTEVSDVIGLDRAAPAPVSVSVAANVLSTTLTTTLAFPADAVEAALAEGSLDCATTTSYTPLTPSPNTRSLGLSAVEGSHAVIACFRDAARNVSQATAVTNLDLSDPVGVVTLANAASFATARDVTVTISASSDVVRMAKIESATAPDCATAVYESFTSLSLFTLSSGDATKTVQVCLEDRAGRRASAVPDTIALDQTAPNGTLVIDDGAAATRSRNVILSLGIGSNLDVSSFAAAEGSITCNAANLAYSPFSPQVAFLLSSGDGTKQLRTCLKDNAGNVSTAAGADSIILDAAPPLLAANPVAIVDGDGFVQAEAAINVTLAWTTAGDAAFAKVGEGVVDCAGDGGYVALPATSTSTTINAVPLSAAEGQKVVGVCFKDAAGNTVAAQDTSVRDNTAPVVTNLACTDCSVDAGLVFSRDASVVLALSVDEGGSGVAQALVSIDGGADTATGVVNGSVTVAGLGAGARLLRVRLIDRAGNTSAIAQSQSINVTIDGSAPVLALAADFRLNGANSGNATNNAVIAVSFNNPPADVTAFALAETAIDCTATSFLPFATNTSFTLSASQGTKTIKLCLRDRAGNVSASAEPKHAATITFDSLPPSLPANAVAVQDGGDELLSSVAGGISVRLSWNTVGDVVAFKLGESSVDCGTEPYERPATIATVNTFTRSGFPLSSVDGTKVVIACFKDAAGNVITGQDTTTLDQAGPNGSIVVDGAATFSTDEIVAVRLRMVADVRRFALAETTATNAACASSSLSCAAASYVDVSGAALIDGVLQLDVNRDVNGAAAAVDGPACFEVCFEDAAGNRTSSASVDGISVDQSAPSVGAGSITLTGLAKAGTSTTLTRTQFISIAVSGAPADTSAMRTSEDSSFAGGTQAFAPFAAATQPLTLSATDGLKSVFVQLKDAAGNVGAATAKSITLDATAPIGVAVVLNNGTALANTAVGQATLQATGATEVRLLTPDNSADAEVFVAFVSSPATVAVTLEDNAAQDGLKTVLAIFRDEAGNEAPAANDAIELDRVGPSAANLACGAGTSTGVCINDGAVATNSVAASLTLAANGATEVAIATDGCADTEAFVPLAPLSTALLPSTDGPKTVAVRFRDAAGNLDQAFVNCGSTPGRTDAIVLDTVAPSAPLAVNLSSAQAGDGAGFSTTAVVDLSFAFSPGAGEETQVKHGEGSVDCGTTSGYLALPAVSPLVVPGVTLSSAEGTKIYAACFKDAAGNVSSTTGQIVVDRTRPSGSIAVAAGQSFAGSTAVQVSLATSDDVAAVAFVNDTAPTCNASLTYVAKAATLGHTLSTGDGSKTVFACFKDSAGNFSATPASDIIVLDTTAPTVSLDVLEGAELAGTHFVNTTQLTLLVVDTGAVDADLLGVAFSQGSLNCADQGIYLPFSSLTSFTTTSGEGDKVINGCLIDESGHATSLSKIVRLDTTPPVGTVVVSSTATATPVPPLAGFTPTRLVNVQLSSAESGLRAKLAADACDGSFNVDSFDGDETRTTTLNGPEGTRASGACLGDAAGNSVFVQGAINLDLTRPEGTAVSCVSCEQVDGALFTAGFDLDGDGVDDPAILLEVEAIDPNANGFVENLIARVDLNSDGDFADTVSGVSETQVEPYDAFVVVRFPAAEAVRTTRLSFVDAAGNESAEFDFDPATTAPDRLVVTFDVTPPVITTFSLRGELGDGTGSTTLTTSRNTNINLVGSADIVGAIITEAPTFDGLVFQSLQNVLAAGFFLSATDADKEVQLQVIDRAGNVSAPAFTTMTLDTTPPVLSSFLLVDSDGGSADITNSAEVTARIDAVGATQMRLISEANPAAALIPFATSTAVLLTSSSVDGEKVVTVVVIDAARNAASANARITLDRTAPVAVSFNCPSSGPLHVGVCIADDDVATDVVTPTASVQATGATLMQVATDGCADTEAFEPFSSFITLVLPGGDGPKTVAVRFRDEAGNDDQSFVSCAITPGRTDTIVLDTVAPNGATVSIANNAAFTTSEDVLVSVSYPVDVVRFALGADTIDCASAAYTNVSAPSPDTTTATLSSGIGTKAVFACFKDAAGNIAGDVDFIALTGAPRIVVDDGARATRLSSNVPVEIVLDPAINEIVQMKIVDNTDNNLVCDGATSGFRAFNISDRVTFNDVRNERKQVGACLKDAGGNISGPFNDDIDLDTEVSSDLVFEVSGSGGNAQSGTPLLRNSHVVAVDVVITAGTIDADVQRIEISELSSFADAVSFGAPAAGINYAFSLSSGDGTKTVRARLIDALGNTSSASSAQIRLDSTAPTDPKFNNGSVLLPGDGSVLINPLVIESSDGGSGLDGTRPYLISGIGPGRCEQLVNDPNQGDGECRWDGRTPFTITAITAALSEGETRLRVRALDAAGNSSGDDVITITLDSTPPTQPLMDALIPGDSRLFASWTPGGSADDQDIAGFRVYYMVSPGGLSDCPSDLAAYDGDFAAQGASPVDVGLDTDIELTDLVNVVAFCVAVMAYDDADNESPFNGQAQSTTPYELPPTTTALLSRAQLGTNGQVGALATRNGFLYVAAQLSPFIELDVTNETCFSASPGSFAGCAQRVPSASTLIDPRDVVVQGSFAFVADAAVGLRVFRVNEGVSLVEEPFSPIASLGGRSFEGAQAVAVDENLLALVHTSSNNPGARGVSLINIAPLFQDTPASPIRLSTINHSDNPGTGNSEVRLAAEGGGVDLQGSRMAIGGDGDRILWSITDPSSPTRLSLGACGGSTARAVRFAGPLLYFVPVDDELVACNLASQGNAVRLSTASTVRARVEVVGPYLITTGSGRMEVLDASDVSSLRFLGRHEGQAFGTIDRGALAVDRTRVYYAGDQGGDLVIADLTRLRAIERAADVPQLPGASTTLLIEDSLLNGDKLAHLKQDGLTTTNTIDLNAQELVQENGTIVSASFNVVRKTRRLGSFTVDNSSALEDGLTIPLPAQFTTRSVVMRWPYVAIHLENSSTGEIALRSVNLATGVLVNQVSVVVPSDGTSLVNQTSLGFIHGALYVAVGRFFDPSGLGDAELGLYRVNWNTLTGVLNVATQVESSSDVGFGGVFPHGNRLYFWNGANNLQANQFLNGATNWNPATKVTLGLSNISMATPLPVAVGNTLYIVRSASSVGVAKLEFNASSAVTSARQKMQFPGIIINSIDVAGDRLYVTQNGRPLVIGRLR